jgi:hypothetical protein
VFEGGVEQLDLGEPDELAVLARPELQDATPQEAVLGQDVVEVEATGQSIDGVGLGQRVEVGGTGALHQGGEAHEDRRYVVDQSGRRQVARGRQGAHLVQPGLDDLSMPGAQEVAQPFG